MKRSLIIVASVALAACREETPPPATPAPIPTQIVVPAQGAYTGAYLDFGETEDAVTLEQIEDFESAVGKHQAIIASSSYWGEQNFPRRSLDIISRHGSIPLIFWSPWDKPYDEDRPPDKFALTAIVDGDWDAYIDKWADGAKEFQRPFFVSWGLEMNGTWFPWSAWFYGERNTEAGHRIGAELYKKAYRHVVDRVRARGVTNILWVFQPNNQSSPTEAWNRLVDYYPGDDYVDWLAMSAYGMQFPHSGWITPKDAFQDAYTELCAISPTKPMMMAEWGIGEFPADGSKAAWITQALHMMEQMPRLKAAVFWNERWENGDGDYSNLRATSSVDSLKAYQLGVGNPFWLGQPQWR
jgi:beta-mannanase